MKSNQSTENGYNPKVGIHTFRHTFAFQLVINGASIYDVQKLMGHSSISMTQIYAHLSEDATRRAVDLLSFNPEQVKEEIYLKKSIYDG